MTNDSHKVNDRNPLNEVSAAPKREWIPLPTFEFAASFVEMNEAVLKGFVKMLISVTAHGIPKLFEATHGESQFVILCKLTEENGKLAFAVYAPFQELVDFAHNHLPPRMKSDRLKQALDSMDLEIHHQYAVPVGCLTPIVVVYRPSERHILLTNENHFANPRQFLNPRICRTTSGFLSFIGAFMLESSKHKPGQPRVFSLENGQDLLNEGFQQWFRWFSHISERAEWETKRIFVNIQNPEEYIYEYDGREIVRSA